LQNGTNVAVTFCTVIANIEANVTRLYYDREGIMTPPHISSSVKLVMWRLRNTSCSAS